MCVRANRDDNNNIQNSICIIEKMTHFATVIVTLSYKHTDDKSPMSKWKNKFQDGNKEN